MVKIEGGKKSIQIKLGGAVATNELDVIYGYTQKNINTSSPLLDVSGNKNTNGATEVTLVPVSGDKIQTHLTFLSVQNTDTAPVTIILELKDDATAYKIFEIIMAVNDNLFYEEGAGFKVLDLNGKIKTV